VREVVGKRMELRFDANQGFTVEEAFHFLKETRKRKIGVDGTTHAQRAPRVTESGSRERHPFR
jgi:hypothetical protein